MAIDITVPVLPESVSSAVVATVNHQQGDLVTEATVLVELETDKIMIEVPAPTSGLILEVMTKPGDEVNSGDVLFSFEEKKVTEAQQEQHHSDKKTTKETSTSSPVEAIPTSAPETTKIGPSARKAIQEHPIQQAITPTGPNGRILKGDVLKAQVISSRQEKRVAMTRIRAKIAERLIDAQQSTACLTTFNEVDMKAVMDLRAKYKKTFEEKHQIKLGFMPFFIKASSAALQKFPDVNASIDEQEIIYRDYQDISIAVSTDRGLVVPVIRDAQAKGMADLEKAVKELAVKARDGKLTLEDMQGGTFSITNAGKFGSMLSTPILNAPQSAILGMHNIVKRPVVINDQVEIRPIMYIALTYDHRMVDGSTSVQFLMYIKELLEDPTRLLLDI
ncbi:MAG: dihydrolipoyllysine-residue succinyltransferase [Legionellales bacterium]|nr:dihydrolipoyllysine-residue succinyltransferase [Legionellales bacterium]